VTPSDWSVRVPASSANLGPGFDVLGMALSLHAEVGVGSVPGSAGERARQVDEHHPATVAFRRLGGEGALWVRSPIPMGRGLGYSGSIRVGGAVAAIVQREGSDALADDATLGEVLDVTAELEGHADNVAPSIFGGIVVCADRHVQRVPLAFDPAIVVWIPDGATTSTDQSRATLPDAVSMTDAVFNLGRVATFVAACAAGDQHALRLATEDRLHQPSRLAATPVCAEALDAAYAAGAWAAWLSGSGPTVAAMCEPSRADDLAAALPGQGSSKVLHIDHQGATVVVS
jgi:homoserine kinase